MNRYESIYNVEENGSLVQKPTSVTAESMEVAVQFITADKGAEPVSISLKEQGAIVVDETKLVTFTTTVTPAGAVSAGAVATPTTFAVVPSTKVIFEANVTAGFDFVKWTKNGVDAGTDLKVEIGITEDATAIVAEYVAQ
jgi:hypothetical protein